MHLPAVPVINSNPHINYNVSFNDVAVQMFQILLGFWSFSVRLLLENLKSKWFACYDKTDLLSQNS